MGMIDAGLNGQQQFAGKAYFFRGDEYVRYDWAQDKVDDGYPQPLSAWHLPGGFASGIDTALNGERQFEGKAYFFRGDQYVRYDWAQDKVDDGYPKPIAGNWSGIERLA
jgi:Hemopexin